MSGKAQGHRWSKLRCIPWLYCPRCGLVWLRNQASERAARGHCEADE
jgi:hypothetical protein